ncbi:MAG: tetraacyldisaccharide 4'-kinase [Alloprevotella sp.]|nr:tetraacyldisaccharide 4'-kinase [Alloprevotella sp.]
MLSWLYASAMQLRNQLFDSGLLHEQHYDIPVVGVGNLAVGGTGKTPHVEWLLRRFPHLRTAVLSRGYGRSTHGFRLVETSSTADEVGDEPLQIKRNFPATTVSVCEKRAVGMSRLLDLGTQPQMVVLDDNFQHRYVRAGLQILLTDIHRLYTRDKVLPRGRLRERKSGATRADVIVVTKCPADLSSLTAQSIAAELTPLPSQHVFFSTMRYAPLRPLRGESPFPAQALAGRRTLLVTGIAHPEPLKAHLEAQGAQLTHLRFADHRRFTAHDAERINKAAQEAETIVTTEKDAMRIEDLRHALSDDVLRKIYVQPIAVHFLFDGEHALSEIVTTFVGTKQ